MDNVVSQKNEEVKLPKWAVLVTKYLKELEKGNK